MVKETAEPTFTFETMAIVLYCMKESGVNLGSKHYEMMAAVDGKSGPAGYQHRFRKVNARAKELQQEAKQDQGVESATPDKGKATKKTTTKGDGNKTGQKRGRKAAAEMEPTNGNVSDPDDEESESPMKKMKEESPVDSEGETTFGLV